MFVNVEKYIMLLRASTADAAEDQRRKCDENRNQSVFLESDSGW
jgi:hypothetical protein